jgi:hypothetical protein
MCKDTPNQNEEIPELYITQYDEVPPIWLLTVGFSRHGKTCYIAALTLMLENLYRVWTETTWFPLDDYTTKLIRGTRHQAFKGGVPEHTEHLRPIFINMYEVPKFKDNCLVIYDAPGEIYEDFQTFGSDEITLRPLKKVKNIWFLVSLDTLDNDPEKKINDLLNIYIAGMQRLKLSLAGRNLIVVYTMADKLMEVMPEDVTTYLLDDPFKNITSKNQTDLKKNISVQTYIEKMKGVSGKLEKYTIEKVPGGGAFVKLARRSGMGLYFSITSALGADPVNGEMGEESAARFRVLDPYLWALHLNEPDKKPLSIKLILDGTLESEVIYSRLGISNLFDALSDMGDVTTYILGQTSQVSVKNQTPPTKRPSIPKSRLIGPILDRQESETVIVVITTGKIEDLADYPASEWASRILIVKIGEEQTQEWGNQIIIRENDENSLVVDEVRRLFVAGK